MAQTDRMTDRRTWRLYDWPGPEGRVSKNIPFYDEWIPSDDSSLLCTKVFCTKGFYPSLAWIPLLPNNLCTTCTMDALLHAALQSSVQRAESRVKREDCWLESIEGRVKSAYYRVESGECILQSGEWRVQSAPSPASQAALFATFLLGTISCRRSLAENAGSLGLALCSSIYKTGLAALWCCNVLWTCCANSVLL